MEDLAKLTKEEEEILMLTKEIWNRVWYQLWITDLDMNCIERYFKGYNEVKRWWLPNLQMWYVFFYRKNGGKVKGVLGRERTNNLLGSIL